jgi:murein DD-endopeptidase MepM/ murein hydrolase activator NlpD
MGGSVIYAGYLSDFGNYVVVKYDNGSYARFGHLSSSTKHLLGKKITPNAFLGYAGSTGRSTGVHLHVDFWDKNRNLISVEKFQKGIR